jgi:hypothetical protein
MYHYQFCDRGYDITGSFSDTREATEVRIWAQDGTLMVCADKRTDGWHISASDAVSNWTEYADAAYPGYRDAITAIFANAEHDHWWNIRTSMPTRLMGAITGWTPYRECALCGKLTPESAAAESPEQINDH